MHAFLAQIRRAKPLVGLALFCLGIIALSLSFPTLSSESTLIDIVPDVSQIQETPVSSVHYVEIIEGCDPYLVGSCANARSAPTTTAPIVAKLRSGIVLAVGTTTVIDTTGREWHEVVFNEWVRYPERIHDTWYVASEVTGPVFDIPTEEHSPATVSSTTKRILIDRSEQVLYAYDGGSLFLQASISTGLDLTPTPRGIFTVYRKTPSRYMQGPLPGISDQYYDLPGVPWNIYFTKEGGAIHGAYWHTMFGKQWSHGCVNLPPDIAKKLYEWTPLGTTVLVQD
ncbi:MAG: hypothetical protein AB203_02620 [Parcubacteria bacterium C7867-008]|nr:MAG: hypothetical protein AB203_02620 [Parcubacteria bacterium C7867-008]